MSVAKWTFSKWKKIYYKYKEENEYSNPKIIWQDDEFRIEVINCSYMIGKHKVKQIMDFCKRFGLHFKFELIDKNNYKVILSD